MLVHVLFDRRVVRLFIACQGLEETAADIRIVQQPPVGDVEKLARVTCIQVSFQLGIRPVP